MSDEFDITILYASVYDFIEETILPPLGWSGFERTFEEYRSSRDSTIHSYIDTLPILTCTAAGGLSDRAIPLAAAWVFYILASKVFDELQDTDGQEDLWNEEGIWTALPAGLFALGAAKASLAHLEVNTDAYADILRAFGRTMSLAAKAQGERLTLETLSIERYFKILAAKTGLIFATGSWAGARLAADEPDPAVLDAFYQYGLNTGIAGQITDDCLDLGQGDLINKTFTLPIVYALSQKQHSQQPQLISLLREIELGNMNDHVDKVTGLLQEMGAIEWSLQIAKTYAGQALTILQGFPKDRVNPLIEYTAGNRNVTL